MGRCPLLFMNTYKTLPAPAPACLPISACNFTLLWGPGIWTALGSSNAAHSSPSPHFVPHLLFAWNILPSSPSWLAIHFSGPSSRPFLLGGLLWPPLLWFRLKTPKGPSAWHGVLKLNEILWLFRIQMCFIGLDGVDEKNCLPYQWTKDVADTTLSAIAATAD